MTEVKYTTSLISPANGTMLHVSFNDIMFRMMKATTVRYIVHKFSRNLYKHERSAKKCKFFCFLSK